MDEHRGMTMSCPRSLTGRVAAEVLSHFADAHLSRHRNVLYLSGFRIVLRGVLVEALSTKNRIRLRALYVLLLGQLPGLPLNDSPDIATLTGSIPELVSGSITAIAASAALGGLDDAAAVAYLQARLEPMLALPEPDIASMRQLGSLAVLTGQSALAHSAYARCLDGIEDIQHELSERHRATLSGYKAEADLLVKDQAQLLNRFLACINANARRLGFSAGADATSSRSPSRRFSPCATKA